MIGFAIVCAVLWSGLYAAHRSTEEPMSSDDIEAALFQREIERLP